MEEHLEQLRLIFSKLQESNLKLKPSKCQLLQTFVEYTGHLLSANGFAPAERLVKAVAEFPQPQTAQEVKRFLGLASYYRRFIARFAELSFPLNQLTHKDAPYIWTDQCEEAFQELKVKLTTAPVLAHPNFSHLNLQLMQAG